MKKNSFFILLSVFILYYFLPLNFRSLWQPDETRYAEISREMLDSGNWIVPHFLGLRYFEKPVLGYWINSMGQWLFGHNNFSVRFGSVFSITLSALLVAWLAWSMWHNKRVAIVSAVIFLTTFLVYSIGTYAVLDPMITLWLVLAMCAFWWVMQAASARKKMTGYITLGVACGMGIMTKGFLALVVPAVAIFPWIIIQQRWKEVLTWGWLAVISTILVVLPWALAIALQEPDFWNYFFWVEHIKRFAAADAQHKSPFWFYLPVIVAGSLPWLGLLPGALCAGWRGKHNALYLLSWVVMPFLFFSIANGKLLTYILPCFAPLAILMAHYVTTPTNRVNQSLKINGWINILFGIIGILIVIIGIAPWGLTPLYSNHELPGVILSIIAFGCWSLVGYHTLRKNAEWWMGAALCPLGVALLISAAIPEKIQLSKQPQTLINNFRETLSQSRYILVENTGIASAVAWELQRSDIILFNEMGEMQYGLNYPEAKGRYMDVDNFPDWLQKNRKNGSVTVIFRSSKDSNDKHNNAMPKADYIYQRGEFMLFEYR